MGYGLYKKANGQAAEQSRRYLRLLHEVARAQSQMSLIGDFNVNAATPKDEAEAIETWNSRKD